jgi:hypothetical protein
MTGSSLVDALIVASVTIAWLFVYKARHKHTDADQLKAREQRRPHEQQARLGRSESVAKLSDSRP